MLIGQQEREREQDRGRVDPPHDRRPEIQPVLEHFFDDDVNDAVHQRGRTEVGFNWIRDPG